MAEKGDIAMSLQSQIAELKKYIEQSFTLQIGLIHQKLNLEVGVEKKYQVGLCEAYLREIASQLARLDTKLTHIDSALTQLDRKLDQMESRLTSKYHR